jgi:hypothetical protein
MSDINASLISRTTERVRRISAEAGAILASLPEAVAYSLISGVPSPRLLTIGLLAATNRCPTVVLSRNFHIPESWVVAHRDQCLRALRVMPS